MFRSDSTNRLLKGEIKDFEQFISEYSGIDPNRELKESTSELKVVEEYEEKLRQLKSLSDEEIIKLRITHYKKLIDDNRNAFLVDQKDLVSLEIFRDEVLSFKGKTELLNTCRDNILEDLDQIINSYDNSFLIDRIRKYKNTIENIRKDNSRKILEDHYNEMILGFTNKHNENNLKYLEKLSYQKTFRTDMINHKEKQNRKYKKSFQRRMEELLKAKI